MVVGWRWPCSMLSLAASRSKTPSALPSDPNIRLGLGETAAKRSFFFACGVLANVYFWPLASFRCRAAIRALSGRSGRWAGLPHPWGFFHEAALFSSPYRRPLFVRFRPRYCLVDVGGV
jgi:hypothetical protein